MVSLHYFSNFVVVVVDVLLLRWKSDSRILSAACKLVLWGLRKHKQTQRQKKKIDEKAKFQYNIQPTNQPANQWNNHRVLWRMLRASCDLVIDAFDANAACRPIQIFLPLSPHHWAIAQIVFVCSRSISPPPFSLPRSVSLFALRVFLFEWVARILYTKIAHTQRSVYDNKNNVSHSKCIVDFNFHVCLWPATI